MLYHTFTVQLLQSCTLSLNEYVPVRTCMFLHTSTDTYVLAITISYFQVGERNACTCIYALHTFWRKVQVINYFYEIVAGVDDTIPCSYSIES
jgi:hypothetical protein